MIKARPKRRIEKDLNVALSAISMYLPLSYAVMAFKIYIASH